MMAKARTSKRLSFLTWEQRQGRGDGPEYRVMVFEPILPPCFCVK